MQGLSVKKKLLKIVSVGALGGSTSWGLPPGITTCSDQNTQDLRSKRSCTLSAKLAGIWVMTPTRKHTHLITHNLKTVIKGMQSFTFKTAPLFTACRGNKKLVLFSEKLNKSGCSHKPCLIYDSHTAPNNEQRKSAYLHGAFQTNREACKHEKVNHIVTK